MQIEKKVIIATHVLHYGAAHALRDYLHKKKYTILFIGLPFYDQKNVILEKYENGTLKVSEKFQRKNNSEIAAYIADAIIVLRTTLKQDRTYGTFIGVNNLNCFVGLLLKKIGRVKRVIYYSIDFVPIRFQNHILNVVYHEIEKFCVMHSDEVWNVSPRIAEGREEFLKLPQKKYQQKVVPIGIWTKDISKRVGKTSNQILFVGHLLKKQGVQLVLDAIPKIAKVIPNFIFVVVGGGEYGVTLQRHAKKLRVQKYTSFKGWIFDTKSVQKIMHESAIGIAMYQPEKERLHNFTYYADPTKIKEYLSNGLPIITTDVPYNANDIENKGCGLVIQYDKDQLANAIISLLTHPKKLEKLQDNAYAYSKEFDWNHIFHKTSL